MSTAPAAATVHLNGPTSAGADLFSSAPAAPEAKKGRKARAPKVEHKADDRTLPAPTEPTKVEVAKAEGALAAAALTVSRSAISAAFAEHFLEEDAYLARIVATPAVEAMTTAAAMRADIDRVLEARLRPLVLDAASSGCALEEIVFWEREAERVSRLYEAMAARVKKKAERVERLLFPLVKEYCLKTPREGQLKSWKFPTTSILVTETEDHVGRLEVVDDDKAARALQKVLGPLGAESAIKVTTKVYLEESKSLCQKRGIDWKTLDGFRWTPPGTKTIGITRRG